MRNINRHVLKYVLLSVALSVHALLWVLALIWMLSQTVSVHVLVNIVAFAWIVGAPVLLILLLVDRILNSEEQS
ncbi:hypothetical protein [Bifidobacterium sp.]|jgi:hypothetical protein|uniref:hypothetical protein n=1 Tax=Bifidobacterium sp. TaxID=41200 RepID=UPI0025BA0609|nr:hypothetical protein [Bifidobacterium sp.]MCI1635166.1 hypothetical protein [Bifidobacterium sp.]